MDLKVTSRFVVFLICCATNPLFAQQDQLVSRHYLMKDGLPEQGSTQVIQDSHGFIWLATYSGLTKFDGYDFTSYKKNPISSNSLANNFVTTVLEDKHGRLWIGHNNGMDLFDPTTEKFILHWPDSNQTNQSHIITTRLREKKDGKIWVCTQQGVFVADPENLSIEEFSKFTLPTSDIGETQDGSIVTAAGDDGGVQYFDSSTGEVTLYVHDPDDPKSIGPNYSSCILIDSQERVWVGKGQSLELFDPLKKSFSHFPTDTYARVLGILENPDGKFWLGCMNGLWEFDPQTA